jgi:hypothetical protein
MWIILAPALIALGFVVFWIICEAIGNHLS